MASQKKQVLQPCITHKAPFNVQVPNIEPKEGEGIPRRHPQSVAGLRNRMEPDIATIYDIVKRGAVKFGDAQALGTRKLINLHEEQKVVKKIIDGVEQDVPKTWLYYEMSGYTYISFNDYLARVNTIGSGLRALGLQKEDRVQIFAATRYVRHEIRAIAEDIYAHRRLQRKLARNFPWLRFSINANSYRI